MHLLDRTYISFFLIKKRKGNLGWPNEPGTLRFKVLQCFVNVLLVLTISIVSNKIINLEIPFLSYLGVISFGIYMWHMPVDYILRLAVPKLSALHLPQGVTVGMYYLLLLLGAITVAAISHTYFEGYFLQLKDRLHPSHKKVAA